MIRLDQRTTGFPLLPTVVTRRAFIRKSLVVAVVAALRQSVSRRSYVFRDPPPLNWRKEQVLWR